MINPLALCGAKETSAVDRIVAEVGASFRTFGGGRDSDSNPVAHALKDAPLQFAAGVDVRAVVEFVLQGAQGCFCWCGARFDSINGLLKHVAEKGHLRL